MKMRNHALVAGLCLSSSATAGQVPRESQDSIQRVCDNTATALFTYAQCGVEGQDHTLDILKSQQNKQAPHVVLHQSSTIAVQTRSVKSSYPNDNSSCTEHLDHINDKLCVYTYPDFRHGRGISIFTTSSASIEFEQRMSAVAAAHGGQDSASEDNVLHPSLQVQSLENRGFGLIATSPIPAGTQLLQSYPVLLVHNAETPRPFERESHLRKAIALLPTSSQNVFNGLAKTYNHPAVHAQDIIKTNTFAIDLSSTPHLAIFPEAARFNHDCAPNAMYYIDHIGLTQTIHATRPIAAGEEVTISYIDPFSATTQRQAELQNAFGFTCSCRRCNNAAKDDARLAEVKILEAQLSNWEHQSEIESWEWTDKAEQLLELYERLKLEGFMNTAYGHAALNYNAVGESGRATMYARKALEAARLRHGSSDVTGSRAVKVWEEFLQGGAWEHWSWNWRRRG